MSDTPRPDTFVLDGKEVPFTHGQSVIEAALAAGHYIPHLCYHKQFKPHGSCKVCTLKVDGRWMTSCSLAAAPGMQVESAKEEINDVRRTLLQMLFVEGNHFCPSCERSGNCVLQAVAYELDMLSPRFDHFFPDRPVDASHPDLLLDFNRCILCELCVRASRELDGKGVFALSGRGIGKHLIVNSESGRLADTDIDVGDEAVEVCPVGVILKKHAGFKIPIGERRFDAQPISASAVQRSVPTERRPRPMLGRQTGRKLRVATTSLAGCFGCHTSLLDIDERLFELLEQIEFDRSPFTDIKHCGPCDIGLIEGGVSNAENVRVLHEFRKHCKTLVAVGACAINGGLPAQRNHLDLGACLQEVYLTEPSLETGCIPNDPELPLPLDKVHPLHEVVKVDYFLPGCPPSADAIWQFLSDLVAGRTPKLGHGLIHYD